MILRQILFEKSGMNRNERHRASESFKKMFSNDGDIRFVYGDRDKVILQFKSDLEADTFIENLKINLEKANLKSELI